MYFFTGLCHYHATTDATADLLARAGSNEKAAVPQTSKTFFITSLIMETAHLVVLVVVGILLVSRQTEILEPTKKQQPARYLACHTSKPLFLALC